MMNQTLRKLADDLEARNIAYAMIGAVALNQHGYQRFTSDIDILLTQDGLDRFRRELIGRGYRPAVEGATKMFRARAENVAIKVITSGEYPGDGKPKGVVFPDPAEQYVLLDDIRTIPLRTLIELKLASGMTGLGRRKDISDVQELIWVLALPMDFAESLDTSVCSLYKELWEELAAARAQETH